MISQSKRLEKYKRYFKEDGKPIFNPLFWHISEYLNNPDIRYIYIYGGSSAGKTYSIMQALSIESLMFGYNCFVMRKYSSTIKDSIYSDFKGFNNSLKKHFNDIVIIQNEIRSNNNLIRFRGVDDSEKLKGISGFTKVFMDEIPEFNYDDFKQVRKRLRGRKNQQIILTWNPISIHHWIKKQVIDTNVWHDLPNEIKGIPNSKLSKNSFVKINKEGNSILIKTTYLDNFWVVGHKTGGGFHDKHVIADFEFDKKNDLDSYKIYALGEWGEPFKGLIFNYKKHWFKYSELPDFDFYETYGLDFGGGGVNEKRIVYPEPYKFDDADGTSTTVLVRLMINKASMSVYVKLLLYKAYISPEDLSIACQKYTTTKDGQYIKKKNILADNARADKIRDLINDKLNVIGAKTKEGGSSKVITGIDIVKKYKIYFHKDDLPAHMDGNNYKWEVSKSTGELTGNPEKKYENVWDSIRYALVNFDLYNW